MQNGDHVFNKKDDGPAAQGTPWTGPRWEHTAAFFSHTAPGGRVKPASALQEFLDGHSVQGWEAVGFKLDQDRWTILFKRPVLDADA